MFALSIDEAYNGNYKYNERSIKMPGVYGQLSKITNATGRSNYLTDAKRQEQILLHKKQMTYDWNFYSHFEKEHSQKGQKNNEAREIIIALPNELSENPIELECICDHLSHTLLPENHDFEYAVHWNHSKTNLHIHLLFSERSIVKEPQVKRYKKDIWKTPDGRLAKANAEGAFLAHQKGEIQRDKEGNVKYQNEVLKTKDVRFKSRKWLLEKNETIANVLKAYGFNLSVQTPDSPYLSHKKLYKGARSDYIQKATDYNEAVRSYNIAVKKNIALVPEQEPLFCKIRKQIEGNVKKANRPEQKITQRAINCILEMRDFVRTQVQLLIGYIKQSESVKQLENWWSSNQDRIVGVLRKNIAIEAEQQAIAPAIENLNQRIERKEKLFTELQEKQAKEREYSR